MRAALASKSLRRTQHGVYMPTDDMGSKIRFVPTLRMGFAGVAFRTITLLVGYWRISITVSGVQRTMLPWLRVEQLCLDGTHVERIVTVISPYTGDQAGAKDLFHSGRGRRP